jgi:hypothetical protein
MGGVLLLAQGRAKVTSKWAARMFEKQMEQDLEVGVLEEGDSYAARIFEAKEAKRRGRTSSSGAGAKEGDATSPFGLRAEGVVVAYLIDFDLFVKRVKKAHVSAMAARQEGQRRVWGHQLGRQTFLRQGQDEACKVTEPGLVFKRQQNMVWGGYFPS